MSRGLSMGTVLGVEIWTGDLVDSVRWGPLTWLLTNRQRIGRQAANQRRGWSFLRNHLGSLVAVRE